MPTKTWTTQHSWINQPMFVTQDNMLARWFMIFQHLYYWMYMYGLQDFRITVKRNKINITWYMINLKWKKLWQTYNPVWYVMPLVLKSRKIMYPFLFWQLNVKFYMKLVHGNAYKLLNLLRQKILNIVYRTDLENDLGKIYLWVSFLTAYL